MGMGTQRGTCHSSGKTWVASWLSVSFSKISANSLALISTWAYPALGEEGGAVREACASVVGVSRSKGLLLAWEEGDIKCEGLGRFLA